MREFVEILTGIIFAIGYGIWWLVAGIIRLAWDFIKAVLSNVYGRIIAAVGAILFAYLVSLWAGFF